MTDDTDTSTILHAQGLCRGCGERYQFLTNSNAGTHPGQTTQTSEYCQCDEPQENVITVVYNPDLYDLVDTYGDGDITLRAACVECDERYYGPMRKACYNCGGETFDRWVEIDRSETTERKTDRPYVAIGSDGDQKRTYDRTDAFAWANEHLAMLEALVPDGTDHWVQVSSYRPEFDHTDGGDR